MSEQSAPIEVLIEKLVHGGSGLARLDTGQAVFVPGVLPGERVLVSIRKKRKGVLEATLVKVLTPSKDRITPLCHGEIECTGATWPHIAYPAQLKHKQEILLDTLKKIGGIEPRRLLPILPSPHTDHYRLRTQFNVRMKDNRQRIGFFRQGSYDLIEVNNAFLIHPVIDKVLKNIRTLSDKLPLLTELHINASPSGEVHLLLFSEQPFSPALDPFFADLKGISPGSDRHDRIRRKKKDLCPRQEPAHSRDRRHDAQSNGREFLSGKLGAEQEHGKDGTGLCLTHGERDRA